MPLALVIVAVVVVALIIGGTFVLGAPVLAIPLLLLAPGPFVMVATLRKQSQRRKIARFREQSATTGARFDARDEQTLA